MWRQRCGPEPSWRASAWRQGNEVWEWTCSGRCHNCDAALPATGHGVDRKDSSVGYTLENVVLACDACSRIKADLFTYDQMLEIGSLLWRWRAEGRWKDPQRKDGRRFGGRPLGRPPPRDRGVEREVGRGGGVRPVRQRATGRWRRLRARPGRPRSVCAPMPLVRAPGRAQRPSGIWDAWLGPADRSLEDRRDTARHPNRLTSWQRLACAPAGTPCTERSIRGAGPSRGARWDRPENPRD